MERTIRQLLDGYLQHLASRRMQFRGLLVSSMWLERWLLGEMVGFVNDVRFISRFHGLLEGEREGPLVVLPGESPCAKMELCVRSVKILVKIRARKVEEVLEDLDNALKGMVEDFGCQDMMSLIVVFLVAGGKWAIRTIEDCIGKMEGRLGIEFSPYRPFLLLNAFNERMEALEEQILARLHYALVPPEGGGSP
jgi:hypothetical protein